ncbi:DUF3318 domain-containing protein [Synechococcus sp. PCC 7336]|uniref:DUF3318 domain-containing protein n=1 Tax=Synechococcus sp. PCC 7336 TaxID=195250 RepID=UPI00034813A0|nr:DUF3318 domain-containing protein [Synechococcus sp. PCC 7336]
MYELDNFDRLVNFLPYEIRPDVALEVGTEEQSRVLQPLWRFPWQDQSRFAIDLARWRQLSGDQQKLYFLREASLATEAAMGNNWAALLLYPALLGAGTTGLLVEMQMSDGLGIGLAGALAVLAFLLLRRSEKGQKAQVAADEYAIRHASQNGYTEQQAASLLLDAWQKVRQLEGRTKINYDTTIRQRNLEYVGAKGLSSSALSAIGPQDKSSVRETTPQPPNRNYGTYDRYDDRPNEERRHGDRQYGRRYDEGQYGDRR